MSGDFDPTSADGETQRDAPVSGHVHVLFRIPAVVPARK